jgi:hypothetical protein
LNRIPQYGGATPSAIAITNERAADTASLSSSSSSREPYPSSRSIRRSSIGSRSSFANNSGHTAETASASAPTTVARTDAEEAC